MSQEVGVSDRDHPTMAEGGRKKGESKAGRRLTERQSLTFDTHYTLLLAIRITMYKDLY